MKRGPEKARGVASSVSLCDWCLGRQFVSSVLDAESWGSKVPREGAGGGSCALCREAYKKRKEIAAKAAAALDKFEFSSLQVGVAVPASQVDAEDELRAKFGLSSGIGIKKALVSLFRREILDVLGKEVLLGNADAALKIDLSDESFSVRSRNMSFMVRYVKLLKGVKTKGVACAGCGGDGCQACDDMGVSAEHPSVERSLVKAFKQAFEAAGVKISWSGSEDDDAMVLGRGRPVFVQVVSPMRRNGGFERLDRLIGGPVQLVQVESKDFDPGFFDGLRKVVRFDVELDREAGQDVLAMIESSFREKGLPSASRRVKKVHWLRITENRGRKVKAVAEMDNGISPWRVVGLKEGEEGIAGLLGRGSVLKACYDILDFAWAHE